MNVDDPLAFFRAEDAEIARIRQEESLRRKWRPPKPSHQPARDPILRMVVWLPSILLLALALIALAIRHEFQTRNLNQLVAERKAMGRFSDRGVRFDSAGVIPGWQCATGDNGWRAVAVRCNEYQPWLEVSPRNQFRNQLLAADADGDPYSVYRSQHALPPPSDKEIIAAFPYLRTINWKPVEH
jgi:hypothetical protein